MPRNRVPFLIAKILSGQRVCFRLSLRLLTPIVVVGAWLALPVGSVPAQADTVSQIWELNYISASYQSMSAAACPSPADCYVGTQSSSVAAILGTKSGGLTWVSQSVPTTSATVNGIACTGDSSCIAAVGQTSNGVASGGLWSTTNGTSWSSQNIPTSVALNDVACPSTSTCFAVGTSSSATGVALGTTDGGSTWTILTVPPGVGALDGVACTSMQDCIAVGGGFDRRDHQWRCDVDHPSTPHRHRWHSDLQQCGVRQLRYVLRRWVNKQRRRGRQDKRWWSLDQPDPSGGPRDFTRHRLSHGQGLHVCRGQSVEFLLDHRH